jgi:hypothetical protein
MSDPRDWRTLFAAAMLEGDNTQLPLHAAPSAALNHSVISVSNTICHTPAHGTYASPRDRCAQQTQHS